MDNRTAELRARSRQQIEQLRNGARNMHKVYYGDLPRPYQFAWSLLDDPETATRMTTEYSDNFRPDAPIAAPQRHLPNGRPGPAKPMSLGAPSPTGVMDLDSDVHSHNYHAHSCNHDDGAGDDYHDGIVHRQYETCPEQHQHGSEHADMREQHLHIGGSNFGDHSTDEEPEHEYGHEDIAAGEPNQREREVPRHYAEGFGGRNFALAAPKPTDEPTFPTPLEIPVEERKAARPRSAPTRRGCDPRWSTEYSDKFRWWPSFGDHPKYICPDGRPEVPPPHIELAPQLYRSPWRTEYQDAFAWVDLMRSAPTPRAEPEHAAPVSKISPTAMTVDSLNDAIRRAEPEVARPSPREQMSEPAHENPRYEPTTNQRKPARTSHTVRNQGRDRRAQPSKAAVPSTQRQHRPPPAVLAASTTVATPRSIITAPTSRESAHSKARSQPRRSRPALRPPRHDILTSNVRYPDLSDKQLGRWRTEYSRSYHWPIEK